MEVFFKFNGLFSGKLDKVGLFGKVLLKNDCFFDISDRSFGHAFRFPEAAEILVRPLSGPFDDLAVNPSVSVLIVTRGHQHDEVILRWAAAQPACYLGMIGSRVKRKTIFEALRSSGVAEGLLDRVRTPMGLDIGARTPGEIAVAVVAEMIAARRRRIPREHPADRKVWETFNLEEVRDGEPA